MKKYTAITLIILFVLSGASYAKVLSNESVDLSKIDKPYETIPKINILTVCEEGFKFLIVAGQGYASSPDNVIARGQYGIITGTRGGLASGLEVIQIIGKEGKPVPCK